MPRFGASGDFVASKGKALDTAAMLTASGPVAAGEKVAGPASTCCQSRIKPSALT